MAGFFSSLTNGLWGYVSPRETQQRRDKPFKAPAVPPTDGANRRRSMSPTDRVNTWRDRSPRNNPKSPFSPRTPSASVSAGRTGRDCTPPSEYLNGSTLMDLGEDALVYNLKTHGGNEVKREEGKEISSSHGSTFDDTILEDTANDEAMGRPTEKYDELEALKTKQAEIELEVRTTRALTNDRLRSKGWTQAEIDLYIQLELRGSLPLLPASWELDFDTLPVNLFIKDEKSAYIRALGGSGRISAGSSDFRAQKALQNLIRLGAKIRDTIAVNKKPAELAAKREVKKYMKWSLADAGLDRMDDAEDLVIVEARLGKETPGAVQTRMLERLNELADKHERLIGSGNDLPALYGILFFHSTMAIICFDPNTATGDGSKDIRTIGSFNFRKMDQDVWNSLAIAIVAMHAREQMQRVYGNEEALGDEIAGGAA